MPRLGQTASLVTFWTLNFLFSGLFSAGVAVLQLLNQVLLIAPIVAMAHDVGFGTLAVIADTGKASYRINPNGLPSFR